MESIINRDLSRCPVTATAATSVSATHIAGLAQAGNSQIALTSLTSLTAALPLPAASYQRHRQFSAQPLLYPAPLPPANHYPPAVFFYPPPPSAFRSPPNFSALLSATLQPAAGMNAEPAASPSALLRKRSLLQRAKDHAARHSNVISQHQRTLKKNKASLPPVDPLSGSRVNIADQPAADKLTAAAEQWLQQQPAPRNALGKVVVLKVAKIFTDHETEINRLGITPALLAGRFNISAKSLTITIAGLKREILPVEPLNGQQQLWLERHALKKPFSGKARGRSIAQFYCQQEAELIRFGITQAQLAKFHAIKLHSLQKRIREVRHGASGQGYLLTAETEKWLKTCCWRRNEDGKVRIVDIAAFWLNQQPLLQAQGVIVNDLAAFHQINVYSLKKQIGRLCKQQSIPPRILTDKARTWLDQWPWRRDPQGKVSAVEIARFCLDQQEALKQNQLCREDLILYHGVSENVLKYQIRKLQQKALQYQSMRLSAEQKQWLEQLKLPGDITPDTVARLCMQQQRQIKQHEISDFQLAEHFSLPVGALAKKLAELRRRKKAALLVLTPAAANWLSEFQPDGKVTVSSIARLCLKHEPQLKALKISIDRIAVQFDVRPDTLYQTISKFRHKKKGGASGETEITIKQEADNDSELTLWYSQQLRVLQRLPVLIAKEDERIALGYEQGPLRELLAEVEVETLKLNKLPTDLKLSPAAGERASQQMRAHVHAAQHGTLHELIKQQGYYALHVDFARPELGTGLIALTDIPAGTMLGIYSGVVYRNKKEYDAAVKNADINFPVYSFELRASRARRKEGGQKKKPLMVSAGIGGHLLTGYMAFLNTAEVTAEGKVLASANNNVVAVKAGHNIIAFIARRNIRAGEELLTDYGRYYSLQHHHPFAVKTEPEAHTPDSSG